MKKLIYIFLYFWSLAILTSCEDYNEKNFEGYAQMERPTNLAAYSYTLLGADFATIGDAVKKDVETLITAEQAKLTAKLSEYKIAKNATDSARIKAEYDALKPIVDANIATKKLDPKYIAGMFLKTNKFFNDTYTASDYAPELLNSKYKFADIGSSVQLSFKVRNDIDTLTIAASNKYTMIVDDYNALGEAVNQPGQFDNFSSLIDPDIYIPRLLSVKYPLAHKDDVKMIKYLFYTSPTAAMTYTLFKFNGTLWQAYSKTEQFVFADSNKWIFDPTISLTPDKNDFLLLMPYIYEKNGQTLPAMEGLNEWSTTDTLRFVINSAYPPASATDFSNVRTEFFFGSSWYYVNIDVRITSRTYASDIQLQKYFASIDADTALDADGKKAAKTAFLEKRVKQGLAIMLTLKYPELEPKVKGVNQHVKVNVQVYDGARWYWTYNYRCVEKGKFNYVGRTKWK